MPIYEYVCEKCKREFEAEQRITDEPLKACPHCRSRKVKRLISRTSFVLKGSGWYSDLYSSPGSKTQDADKGEKKEAEKPAAGGGDSDGKSEKKSKPKGQGGDKKKGGKAAA